MNINFASAEVCLLLVNEPTRKKAKFIRLLFADAACASILDRFKSVWWSERAATRASVFVCVNKISSVRLLKCLAKTNQKIPFTKCLVPKFGFCCSFFSSLFSGKRRHNANANTKRIKQKITLTDDCIYFLVSKLANGPFRDKFSNNAKDYYLFLPYFIEWMVYHYFTTIFQLNLTREH